MWTTKLNLARLLMDNSVQKLITTVHQVRLHNRTHGTHQLLARNHHPTGLRYTAKYRPPKYYIQAAELCHSVTTVTGSYNRCT